MAKKKYYYAVLHKETGALLTIDNGSLLAIYADRPVAAMAKKIFGTKDHIVHPISISGLNDFLMQNHTGK